MKTTRRNFLASIPILAAIFGIKVESKNPPTSKPLPVTTCCHKPIGYRITASVTAGENLTAGQCVFFGKDGKVYTTGEMFGGIAMESADANRELVTLIKDVSYSAGDSEPFVI